MNVFSRQLRIVLENIRFGPPLTEEVDDQLDGQSGPSDDRLAYEDLWIDDDALLPGHGRNSLAPDYGNLRRPSRRLSFTLSPSTSRSQPSSWFQLAKMRHHQQQRQSLQAEWHLYLAQGVTTVRDMGAERFAEAKRWRDRIAAGELSGPRMRIASPIVENADWLAGVKRMVERTRTPCTLSERFGPTSAAEAVSWVDSVAALGPDHIKVRNWPAPDIGRALVEVHSAWAAGCRAW
jgi:hypothetical protein